jgi:hypothetical protein
MKRAFVLAMLLCLVAVPVFAQIHTSEETTFNPKSGVVETITRGVGIVTYTGFNVRNWAKWRFWILDNGSLYSDNFNENGNFMTYDPKSGMVMIYKSGNAETYYIGKMTPEAFAESYIRE